MSAKQVVDILMICPHQELILLALQLPSDSTTDEILCKMGATSLRDLRRIYRVVASMTTTTSPSNDKMYGCPISRTAMLKGYCVAYCANFKRHERKLVAAQLGTKPKHLMRTIATATETELETLFELCRALSVAQMMFQ